MKKKRKKNVSEPGPEPSKAPVPNKAPAPVSVTAPAPSKASERMAQAVRQQLVRLTAHVHDQFLRARGEGAAGGSAHPLPALGPGSIAGVAWDGVVPRSWHPLFDVAQVGVEALEEAATAMAVAQGRGPELQHPRVGVPRPPHQHKRVEACRSTEQMDAAGLLTHLQELPWYQGQVRVCVWGGRRS